MSKQAIITDVQNLLKDYANTLEYDEWAWCVLPSSENYSYIALLEWQEGFDKNDHETFVKDGYGLDISVRIDNGQYFKCDNPYPICDEHGDCLTGCGFSDNDIKDNFKSMAEYVYDLYNTAIECESFSQKYIKQE